MLTVLWHNINMYLKVRNHWHIGRKPRRLDCPECGETLKGKKCLAEHFQSVHSASLYKCSTCSKTFKKRKNYANHLKIHEKGAGFECVYCSRLFRFKSYLRRHIKRAHQALTSIEVFEVGSERHHEDNLLIFSCSLTGMRSYPRASVHLHGNLASPSPHQTVKIIVPMKPSIILSDFNLEKNGMNGLKYRGVCNSLLLLTDLVTLLK